MFARLKTNTQATVECIHNRDFEVEVEPSQLFHLLGDNFNKIMKVDKHLGEVAIYSPNFQPEHGCAWVGLADDFDIIEV